MRFLIRTVGAHAPGALKKKGVQELFRVTGAAFGCAAPDIAGLSFDECIAEYARFTRSEAGKLPSSGGGREAARERLFRGGRALGGRMRKVFLIATMEDAVLAMSILYRAIGIEARSEDGSAMTVSSCCFSGAYSPETCRVISALDDGIFAGLSGGGRLTFDRRITDGFPACSARIVPGGAC